MSEIEKERISKLMDARVTLSETTRALHRIVASVDSQIGREIQERDQTLLEMYDQFRVLLNRVSEPIAVAQAETESAMQRLKDFALSAESCVAGAESAMKKEDSNSAASEFIGLVHEIDRLDKEVSHFNVAGWTLPAVPDEVHPPMESFQYAIPDFLPIAEHHQELREDETRFLYSDPFRLYSLKWRLKVFPAGAKPSQNPHLAIFLELLGGIRDSVSVFYAVELENQADHTAFKKTYKSSFGVLDSWGWVRMISLAEIPKYVDESGALAIKLTLRPESYQEGVKIARYQNQLASTRLQKLETGHALA
jgi:hypothetical protein